MTMRMRVPCRQLVAGLALAIGHAGAARAEPVVVKIATVAPDGSPWSSMLKETAEAWRTASGGRVALRVYPGGVAGDEPDVVRKMREGRLQAGALSAVGLAEIDPSVHAMSVPMLYGSEDEAYAVLEGMRPRLEAALSAKGFVVLSWADAGWVRFFARAAVATPDDLRALKLFTWDADPRIAEVWRSAGFDPVALPSTEIGPALRSGRIAALECSPQVAVIARYHEDAPHMTDLRWQFLIGATVVTREAWERIPADIRPALRNAAAAAAERLRAVVRQGEARDLAAMESRGLHVVRIPAATREQWARLAESLHPKLRGAIVPADAFDEALHLRDESRRRSSRPKGVAQRP